MLGTVLCAGCSYLARDTVQGTQFRHMLAANPSAVTEPGNHPLHIYIHGDGQPFVTPSAYALDPSPRRPLVIDLLQQDPAPAIMLGRPCYFDVSKDDICHPAWWTSHRYASEVVNSMVAVVNKLASGRRIVLIGYSGGGSLAVLMAPHIDNLAGLITLAANLDSDWWTEKHKYTPLAGSLNPIHTASASRHIPQRHYFGAKDSVVPPGMVEAISGHLPEGSITTLTDYDHNCCWREGWPELLEGALQSIAQQARHP